MTGKLRSVFLTRFALRNPVAVTLLYAFLGVMGVLAFMRMGRGILPPVAFPIVVVSAPYPGAASVEMERLVIEPLEDQLGRLAGVERISASAQDGTASLSVRFHFGANLDAARASVQQAVNAAQPNLPGDLVAPVVSGDDVARAPVLQESVSSAVLTPAELSRLADRTIAPALRGTPGIGGVRVSGELVRQLHVEPREDRLAAVGATMLDLARAVAGSQVALAGGRFVTSVDEAPIGVRAAAPSAAALAQLPFTVPGGGTSLRVGDVARVSDGYAERSTIARVDGEPAIIIDVTGSGDANGALAIRSARRAFARLGAQWGLVRFEELRSDAPSTDAAIGGVLQTLGEGVLLTVLVMLVFLRAWRDATIAAVSIPASLCAAFAAMWGLGFTVNVLSLMGLSLTIGILVDDSIVIVEAISRYAARGASGDEAALRGRAEIGGVAVAITLVDVAVFAPIALMSGIVGEFMREFGLVVVIATAFSLFASFTLAPLLAARWAHRQTAIAAAPKILPWTLRGRFATSAIAAWRRTIAGIGDAELRVTRTYARRWLGAAWRTRKRVLALAALLCIASVVPIATGAIPTEFSPPTDRGEVTAELSFPAGTTLAHVDASVARLARRLLDDPGVAHVVTTAGRSSSGSSDVFASDRAEIHVVTAGPSLRGAAVLDRIKPLAPVVPDAAIAGAGTGMGGLPAISYHLTGEPAATALAASRIAAVLAAQPAATDVRTSSGGLGPRFDIDVDPARAVLLGTDPGDVAQTARLAGGGAVVAKARIEDGLIDVLVRGRAARTGDLAALRRATIRAANGTRVPLSAVARIRRGAAPLVIDREDRERIVTVSANARDGAPIGPLAAIVAARMRTPGFLPDGVRIAPRGDVEQFLDTVARIAAALGLSLLGIFAILAILYRSYALPVVIMATVPLAALGAFGALWAMNVAHAVAPGVTLFEAQTLNLYSMLGIVMLVGLVAKNGILLVEYAERDVRSGAAPLAAMQAAAERRFRAIVMTTAAMIAGMTPLALGQTAGAEYRKALGTVVIGGLSSSLLLTLFVVPLVYVAYRSRYALVARHQDEPVHDEDQHDEARGGREDAEQLLHGGFALRDSAR